MWCITSDITGASGFIACVRVDGLVGDNRRIEMGMFDSVFVRCPKCGEEVEFQSKAGVCELKRYSANNVPPEIAQDISGDVQSCECGEMLKLITARPIERVQMVLDVPGEWD